MQGPINLDLARILAAEHIPSGPQHDISADSGSTPTLRHRLGNRLIRIGESLAEPGELQLTVSTGRPRL
ncbi:MAG: hypothetical protein WBV06_06095 [Acidimicrobiia bacterium]